MSAENHPAYVEERTRLKEALRQVDRQLLQRLGASEIQVEDTDQYEESMHAIRAAQEALETMRDEAVERLTVAVREPYFGRIDFQETDQPIPQALYIGKSGIEEERTNRPMIIDWRAPVASLFYAGTSRDGLSSYVAPGGVVEGTLWLKRNLAVKRRTLQHIADAHVQGEAEGEAVADTFLLYRLQESRDKKLRDIVSTIQQEQNAIIRAERERPLIIQGVAGSGKTTVALHRLAYLLYAYRESVDAERMVIFAPNRMFLDYIADVLPELGVGGIKQVTFADWAMANITEPLELVDPAERLATLFAPGSGSDAGEEPPGRFKGSLFFKLMLDTALDRYESSFVPRADLVLWPGRRISHREIARWFHEHYRGQPLNSRKERIFSRLRTWARSQVDPYQGTLKELAKRKAMATAVRQYLAQWPKHTPFSLYKEILGLGSPRGHRSVDVGAPDIPASVLREARELFKKKVITAEDLAPVLYLQERLLGLKENRELDHVVIDEAQDFSPFQIDLLRRLTRNDSFTILGDLSQGIHTYAGITDWSELIALFPPDTISYHVLDQSYRSTYEIISVANQVLIRIGSHGPLAQPVMRQGGLIRILQQNPSNLHEAIAHQVRGMQEKNSSVAVITRTDEEAGEVHAYLKAAGLEPERIQADHSKYLGGLSVIPCYLAKGLEFDGVILANASAENYGLTLRDARLLFVSLTRALHDLTILYTSQLTPLLDQVPKELVDTNDFVIS